MALAKNTIMMVVIGVVVLIVGIGGGVFVGLKYFSPPAEIKEEETEPQIPTPGPMLELGQFVSTMADPETHVVRVKVTVELSGPNVVMQLADPGWLVLMKDEILKTLKDQRYDNVRYAEGMEKLKQDLKSRLNTILPRVDGNASVNRVLFDEFMTQ
ncbi:MAG: flagellar basal body-associated FliL family protein [Synergistaceae bacterium]|jgi:flagellar FliL protein|nr:flagellar basal body-associated FliL family protein [Synergistaceae bacterium]